MRIGLAQTNPIVGAFDYNLEKAKRFIEEAKRMGCDLVIFPEFSLIGYPPKDLLEKEDFVENNLRCLDELIRNTEGIAVVCGFIDKNSNSRSKPLNNAAVFFENGKILLKTYKILLPSYDVFDEARYFSPGKRAKWLEWRGKRIGITICEDIWNDKDFPHPQLYEIDPVANLAKDGIDILINISASPYYIGKVELRQKILAHLAKKYNFPIVYVNQVGGNDELIFDGNSKVVLPRGIASHAKDFDEDLVTFDLEMGKGVCRETSEGEEAILKALILGTRDYAYKSGFKKAVVGLSGGIDSSLVAWIAREAFGRENVLGVSMPSPYTSKISLDGVYKLVKNLGIKHLNIPISGIFNAYLDTLRPIFEGLPWDVTEENIQARIRGNILMALSNKFGYLVLSTGNKSEMAVGYCTLYGDLTGGLAVISDVPKTLVYRLASYINREEEIIPIEIIKRPPSAELRPNQRDEDDLPPYSVLDLILKEYIENSQDIKDIVKMGFSEDVVKEVVKRVDRNEYKRYQAPPGLKITTKAFGYGRRYPIVQHYTDYLLRNNLNYIN